MRSLLLVSLAFLLGFVSFAHAEEEPEPEAFLPHSPTDWLVIGPVDHRARRPFNPDAVFAKHLLAPASAPPKAGESLKGERGEAQTWTVKKADGKGNVGGRIAWAYTKVVSPEDQIVMAWLRSGGTLFVNGTPHAGAIYGDRFEVPVKLAEGDNHVYVKGVRGAFALTFSKPPAGIFLAPFRQTKPDLVTGEPVDTVAGFLIVNARARPLGQVLWHLEGNDWLAEARSEGTLPIAPMSMIQVRIPLKTRDGKSAPTEPGKVEIPIRVRGAYTGAGHETTFALHVRPREKAVIRTFVSQIDDSVQRFGMREPLPGGPQDKGLVLSLHGAGVNPRGQANAYARKKDFWLFAPTNRDRFGFDWQDWGRLDAYEVLAQGLRISGVDRSRVYLTGHSMGGHGTWHLGANDPDGFAAIAPSAGWISFDTYGRGPRRRGALTDLWHAADGASKTRTLLDNLTQLPTFILHGEKDDNVPVAQAKEMETLLTDAGAKPEVHYEPGKKHWWDGHPEPGAQCVDWPGIYALFRRTRIAVDPKSIRFRGVHPSVDSRHHWLEVLQLARYGKPFSARGTYDPESGVYELTTENVAALRIHAPSAPRTINVDGIKTTLSGGKAGAAIHMRKERELESNVGWSVVPAFALRGGKSPVAGGPFKQAFTNRFVLVYGTSGDPAMEDALLEQARFDGQRWMYRANGQALLLTDAQFRSLEKPLGLRARNVVVYGSSSTNRMFAPLTQFRVVPKPPAHPSESRHEKDIGGYYVRQGRAEGTLVGVCASTGIPGARLGFTTMLFVSGAGWPDYVFFDKRILTAGDGGVREAGWYDRRWTLQKSQPKAPVKAPR